MPYVGLICLPQLLKCHNVNSAWKLRCYSPSRFYDEKG